MKAILPLLVASVAACAPGVAPPPPLPTTASSATAAPTAACGEPARRELDFWLGDWDLVVRARPDPASQEWAEARGVSAIRSVLGGCAIEESFHADGPRAPWAGRSFSTYVPGAQKWRQTWVDDSGSYLAFTGGRDAEGFALYGEPREGGGRRREGAADADGLPRDHARRPRLELGAGDRAGDGLEGGHDDPLRPSPRRGAGGRVRGGPNLPRPRFLARTVARHRRGEGRGDEPDPEDPRRVRGGRRVEGRRRTEGRSLFFHPPASSAWAQIWITPAATSPGGTKEKQLVSRGPDGSLRFQGELPLPSGRVLLDRTTLTPLPGGRVHQRIEISRDIGAHWEATFDGTYERI